MNVVAIIASYPPRSKDLRLAVSSLAHQVDRVHLVLNEYASLPPLEDFPANVQITLPPEDLKDTGKFAIQVDPDDVCLLCDDDITYPPDYADRMCAALAAHAASRAVLGLHGVIYSDFFDGAAASRIVHVFTQALAADCSVNQLGTGTVACRGWQMPEFGFIRGSQRFVDVRFARHCAARGYPMICLAREAGWLREHATGPSLFETFTRNWPPEVIREAHEIGGLRRLPPQSAAG